MSNKTEMSSKMVQDQEDAREAFKEALEGSDDDFAADLARGEKADAEFYAELEGDYVPMAGHPRHFDKDDTVGAIVITDGVLQDVVDIRARLKQAKALVKDLEAQEAILAGDVMKLLADNVPCVGKMQAFIDQKDGRSTPAWKEEYITHMMAEHKAIKKQIEAAMKLKYPAKPKDVLVIAGFDDSEGGDE